jgi:hypothetical protein
VSHADRSPLEDRPIPVSKGLPGNVQMLLAIAVIVVFVMGAFVVISSGFGRVWPAADSVKVPLTERR